MATFIGRVVGLRASTELRCFERTSRCAQTAQHRLAGSECTASSRAGTSGHKGNKQMGEEFKGRETGSQVLAMPYWPTGPLGNLITLFSVTHASPLLTVSTALQRIQVLRAAGTARSAMASARATMLSHRTANPDGSGSCARYVGPPFLFLP